jgi:hypothetical protein
VKNNQIKELTEVSVVSALCRKKNNFFSFEQTEEVEKKNLDLQNEIKTLVTLLIM